VTEVPTVKVNRALKAFHRSYVRNINNSWYMHQKEVQLFKIVILSYGQMSSKILLAFASYKKWSLIYFQRLLYELHIPPELPFLHMYRGGRQFWKYP